MGMEEQRKGVERRKQGEGGGGGRRKEERKRLEEKGRPEEEEQRIGRHNREEIDVTQLPSFLILVKARSIVYHLEKKLRVVLGVIIHEELDL
eukprot:764110-Hanusia_phi.AAC.3